MAGAGYKLFNTGDVLTAAQVNTYLMEQTVMVFADAAARTAALSGVVSEGMISYLKDTNAVEVYNGSAWVASDDPNAIQNTIVDAKGDLITATAADTPARLAVGNNGETLVADDSTSTGLRYNPQNALANPVINGGLDIWQRGTSFASSTTVKVYTADRWGFWRGGLVAGGTVSRQTVSDSTNLPNIQYAARIQRDSGNTSTQLLTFASEFETVNSIPFAGKAVTLSFYARKGANYSPTNSDIAAYLVSGTGTDQQLINGFTGQTNVASNASVVLTTTWQRFALTGTVPTNSTQLGISIGSNAPVGTAGANDWFEVTGVQVDLGTYTASSAPTFRRTGGTLAGELAACQRYFYKKSADSSNAYAYFAQGTITSATRIRCLVEFPTAMRSSPTITRAGNMKVGTAGQAVTASSIDMNTANGDGSGTKVAQAVMFDVASGLTTGQSGYVYADNDTTASLSFSAEL